MHQVTAPIVIDLDAYEAVFTVLSAYGYGDTISTRVALDAIHRQFPDCECSDEGLVAIMVGSITGRTIAVSFDHRQAA